MEITPSKILALLIAVAYMVCIFAGSDGDELPEIAFKGGFALLCVLALIWFPEELGSMTGSVGRGGYINRETPGCMLSAMGWLFLVGMPLALWWFS